MLDHFQSFRVCYLNFMVLIYTQLFMSLKHSQQTSSQQCTEFVCFVTLFFVQYLPEELVAIYRNDILPLADIVTPNQFEAEYVAVYGFYMSYREQFIVLYNIYSKQRCALCMELQPCHFKSVCPSFFDVYETIERVDTDYMQAKVFECGFGLWHRLNNGPVFDTQLQ